MFNKSVLWLVAVLVDKSFKKEINALVSRCMPSVSLTWTRGMVVLTGVIKRSPDVPIMTSTKWSMVSLKRP